MITEKIWTQADIDAVEPDKNGFRHFPAKTRFGADCHFGADCRFGADCLFGEHCHFGVGCHFGAGCCFGGFCCFGGCCFFGAHCGFWEGCHFGENCLFGEFCDFEAGCEAESPYWQFMYPCPIGKIIGLIYPPSTLRAHYQERLSKWGIDCSGCYDDIFIQVFPKLDEILADPQWLPVERQMLESLRNWSGYNG